MSPGEIDTWLDHLQSDVEQVGDQLHQLITTLVVVGILLIAAVVGAALGLYLWA